MMYWRGSSCYVICYILMIDLLIRVFLKYFDKMRRRLAVVLKYKNSSCPKTTAVTTKLNNDGFSIGRLGYVYRVIAKV